MIQSVTMYIAICDNCKINAFENENYSCYIDEECVKRELDEINWYRNDPFDYCGECWSYGKDDEIMIDKTRFKL